RMQGMIVFDWKHRYGEALQALAGHLAAGKLKYRESVVHGLDNAPRGLIACSRASISASSSSSSTESVDRRRTVHNGKGPPPDHESLGEPIYPRLVLARAA